MLFKWKDTYSCDIKSIDDQHKRLFELGGQLYDIVLLGDECDRFDDIYAILMELKEYTVYHFNFEEALLKENGFDDLDIHMKEHSAFIDKLNHFKEEDIDQAQEKVTMDMIMFVANWIEGHILKSDMAYKDLLIAKGVQ